MTDTSGGSEEEDEEILSDFEQSFYDENSDHLYLFIETLTGTSFEMRVSPFETIVSIKAKLQQLEGIPVTQQHLLFNNTELANTLSLYECQVPDGATLKLVLSMRGGPINTRKIPLQDESRELQEVMERSKEELLDQIPEGGHVTVLVFRDGDQINLYHVLERPDGSYSPLSDSLSGTSIRNLFAEQDDPEVQERLQENANTMSKMQDIKTRMQDKRSRKVSHRKNSSFKRPKSGKHRNLNLPPLQKEKPDFNEKETSSNELDFKNLTSSSQIHKSSNHFHNNNNNNRLLNRREPLPRVKDRKSTLDLSLNSPRLSSNSNNIYEHSNFPNRLQSSKKLISLDVSELRSNESVSPKLVSKSEKLLNRNSDRLSSSLSSDLQRPSLFSPSPLETKLAEAEARLRRGRSGRNFVTSESSEQRLTTHKFRVPYLNLESEKHMEGMTSHRGSDIKRDSSVFSPDPKGLDKRLLNSRGRLKSISSPIRRSVLASPKLNSPRTPKSSAGRLRPSYHTRPLSGPKRKKTPRQRCGQPECRKKLNITNSFSCRCDRVFCPLHRHPESHSCSYDYRTEGRKILEAANPLVSIPKLPKI